MALDDFEPPPPPVATIPVADVNAAVGAGNIEYEAFPVKTPEADINDFKVRVRASALAKCRSRLMTLASPPFPWHELALAISTLTGGAYLGALPSSAIQYGTFSGHFFYTFLPITAVGAFIAYLFLRRAKHHETAAVASQVLDDLPDPDKAR